MSLNKYKNKRNFKDTPEPQGNDKDANSELPIFVVQKHDASHLHYDLRIEHGGALKSWAVPKGPSLDPTVKRLAVQVEDHPMEYARFHGSIPKGNYGAGSVEIWDSGTYTYPGVDNRNGTLEKVTKGFAKGHILLNFNGKKLKGKFSLLKFKTKEKNTWLLSKLEDDYTQPEFYTDTPIDYKKLGLKKSSLPDSFSPMLAELAVNPFNDPDWVFEPKLDGYRLITIINNNKISLLSRNGVDFSNKFSYLIENLKSIKPGTILDGEVVAYTKDNKSDFNRLKSYNNDRDITLIYYIFDLPYYDQYNLCSLNYLQRKQILKEILPESYSVKYTQHFEDGLKLYEAAQSNGLEGIIGKNTNSKYLPGLRTDNWKKFKITKQIEAYIIGFTEPAGLRKNFGALALGRYKGKKLEYLGDVGSGFNETSLNQIFKSISNNIVDNPGFQTLPPTPKRINWVKPKYKCLVKYSEITNDGYLRHPVFLNLTGIKTQDRNLVNKYKKVELSNLNKLIWPDENITKAELISYYKDISEYMLKFLKDKPESLHRYPDGIKGEGFYQKDLNKHPAWVQTIPIESEEKTVEYLLCQNAETLVYMANLACIEIHPWHSRIKNLDKPDYMVIDLDPVEIDFTYVIKTALEIKKLLDEIDIPCFCKTTGIKGLHIYIPLKSRYFYSQVLQFAQIIAELIHERLPEITSLERRPTDRKGKIYLDIYQNRKGQTIVAPYSLRPLSGAPVSAPLYWEELDKNLKPQQFNMKNIFHRLDKSGDIWKNLLNKGVDIQQTLLMIKS